MIRRASRFGVKQSISVIADRHLHTVAGEGFLRKLDLHDATNILLA